MKYNFDQSINRLGTCSAKWDGLKRIFGRDDVLALWVADMDFVAPDPVKEALLKRVEHGIYGYGEKPDSLDEAIMDWFRNRHGWIINREWISFCPGVVKGLNVAINALTHPGDKVIIQTPVYYPFNQAIEYNGCQVVKNPP